MKPYTVILQYLKFIDGEFGKIYAAHVTAENGNKAVLYAKNKIAFTDLNLDDDEAATAATDLAVIAVFDGHLEQSNWNEPT